MKARFLTTLILVALLSGCSAYKTWYGETKPMMTFAELPSESKLFVWSPKNNAAFINKDGKGCVQGAEVFNEQGGSLDISNSLLGILKGIQISDQSKPEDKALAAKITNDIIALRTNTERNTYLSIGMFGICQLQINGGLTNSEVLQLSQSLINSSLAVGGTQTNTLRDRYIFNRGYK